MCILKNLFEGEWHYKQTITKSNVGSSSLFAGMDLTYDSQFKEVSKIRIDIQNNYLVAYTLNTEDIETQDTLSLNKDRWVFKIPIVHLDYWTHSSGKGLAH